MTKRSSVDTFAAAVQDIHAATEKLGQAVGREQNERYQKYAPKLAAAVAKLWETDISTVFETDADPASQRDARHDLRNLLNHIAGPLQMLERAIDDPDGAEILQAIKRGLDRCVSVVNDQADDSSRPDTTENRASRRVASPARVLIAEDDDENRVFLTEVLGADGHHVDVVTNGVDALATAAQHDYDLILLDLGLPNLSGFEVLERLQADGWQTPVIVVTGRRGVDDAVRCIEHGADDFLTKPIQIELLRARVSSSVDKMRLREREFGQFFPPKLARMFARRPSLVTDLPSKHAEVSVLFCDIRNFTAISERLGPETTTRWLRSVMNELSEIIIAYEGVLVDFAGDEIMAMWGAPEEVPDHAERACDTAVAILNALPDLNARWQEELDHVTDLAIGVSSGRAMVGHIGTARKTKYGALGDTVNLGSRVLGATKHLQARLLITGDTRALLGSRWNTGKLRRLCRVRVHHVEKPVELYEVSSPRQGDAQGDLPAQYEAALTQFENGAWQQASAILGQLLVEHPEDGPSLMLMSRVVDAMLSDGSDFDTVWTLSGK